jgi:hypothetical protein
MKMTSVIQHEDKIMNDMIERDIEAMLENPVGYFDKPVDVVRDSKLSLDEKKQILDAWEEDARRLAVATEEGMSGGEPSNLAEVAEAKVKLGPKGLDSDRPDAPTKAG